MPVGVGVNQALQGRSTNSTRQILPARVLGCTVNAYTDIMTWYSRAYQVVGGSS